MFECFNEDDILKIDMSLWSTDFNYYDVPIYQCFVSEKKYGLLTVDVKSGGNLGQLVSATSNVPTQCIGYDFGMYFWNIEITIRCRSILKNILTGIIRIDEGHNLPQMTFLNQTYNVFNVGEI